tara:strand:+ start:189 stop:629 length:441 start_codon:yes stop_codon:yes gene_type:complete
VKEHILAPSSRPIACGLSFTSIVRIRAEVALLEEGYMNTRWDWFVVSNDEQGDENPTWAWDCDVTGRKYTITFGAAEEIFDGAPSSAIWYSNPNDESDYNDQPILLPTEMLIEALVEVYGADQLDHAIEQHLNTEVSMLPPRDLTD